MASYRLAIVIKNSSGDDFIITKQDPTPSLPEEEYQQFVDSDLWDLPSALLKPTSGEQRRELAIQGAESVSDKLDLGALDVGSGIDQVNFV